MVIYIKIKVVAADIQDFNWSSPKCYVM